MDSNLNTEINYYIKEGYYCTALKLLEKELNENNDTNHYKFYHSIILILQNRFNEAENELKELKDSTFGLASLLGLIFICRRTPYKKNNVKVLNMLVRKLRKKANEIELYYTGFLCNAVNMHDECKKYVELSLKKSENSQNLCLNGCIKTYEDLYSAKEYFQKSLNIDPHNMDAKLGIVVCFEAKVPIYGGRFLNSIDYANKIIADHSGSIIPYIEKMKYEFSSRLFSDLNETIAKTLAIDNECIEALGFKALQLLCYDGAYKQGVEAMSCLYDVLEKKEPTGHSLFYDYCIVFSRVCSQNKLVLNECEKFIKKANSLKQECVKYVHEMGYVKFKLGCIEEAYEIFNGALTKFENPRWFLLITLACKIYLNKLENFEGELESTKTAISGVEAFPLYHYIKVLYNKKLNKTEEIESLLDKAILSFQELPTDYNPGKMFIINKYSDMILIFVEEYLNLLPDLLPDKNALNPESNKILRKIEDLLSNRILNEAPGLIEGIYYLARVKYLQGNYALAKKSLFNLLEKDPAHLVGRNLRIEINMELFRKKTNLIKRSNDFSYSKYLLKILKSKCPICLIDLVEKERIELIETSCKHLFCRTCLERAIEAQKSMRKINNECSYCKSKIKFDECTLP